MAIRVTLIFLLRNLTTQESRILVEIEGFATAVKRIVANTDQIVSYLKKIFKQRR
jgi:hypothetical protein